MRWLATLALCLLLGGEAMAGTLPKLVGALGAPGFWQSYKASFISPGGRVMDNANGNISHSEGQGYGMLLAVGADDPATFDTLWTWTRSQLMLRDDGLAAWKWDPAATPHVADRNNASDGDLLIAWALAEAGDAWSQPAYKSAALVMIRAIAEHDVGPSAFGPVLKPGTAGFAARDRNDGPVVNPSYWVFPALARFAVLMPDGPFAALRQSGLKLIAATRFGPRHLPSDWVSLAGSVPVPASGFPATFGYDAIRIPLYLAWGGVGDAKTLEPFGALFANPADRPMRIEVASGTPREPLDDSGYRAVAALTRCILTRTPLPSEFQVGETDRYYPSTLRALVLIASHQMDPACS